MYLKRIVIKDTGPISNLDIELPFNENGDPKPVILVGKNGVGKTILGSQIIDGFYEVSGSIFDDIREANGSNYSYYKLSGGLNLKSGKNSGYSLLRFSTNESNIDYFDKAGDLGEIDFSEIIDGFNIKHDGKKGPQKKTTSIPESLREKMQDEWMRGVHIYQPAYRYEEPFWRGQGLKKEVSFEDRIVFNNELDKEIEIISSLSKNKDYLLNIVMDFVRDSTNIVDRVIWSNINNLIKEILQKDNIRFGIGPRGKYRINIVELNNQGQVIGDVVPSIDCLSLGESVLLNLFLNILRHGDGEKIEEIKGIIVIDEIDVHLHSNLQHLVLPKLMKLFPKVQFIITTHSPLFVLGMNNVYGSEDFLLADMPKGESISMDRFSEFENAYEILKNTEKFEKSVEERTLSQDGGVVYVEGPTDVKYLEKAFSLFDIEQDNFKIEIIGEETPTGTINSNDKMLKNAGNFLSCNPNLITNKIVILHDPETGGIDEGEINENLFIAKINKNEDSSIKGGIENLFTNEFIKKIKEEDLSRGCIKTETVDGVVKKDIIFKKQEICNLICEKGGVSDFENFRRLCERIKKFFNPELEQVDEI